MEEREVLSLDHILKHPQGGEREQWNGSWWLKGMRGAGSGS